MTVNLTINGNTFAYPVTGDDVWGAAATGWAVAVTGGMLQKSGGLFTLLGQTDFGPDYGLTSINFTSRSTDPASAGILRLSNSDTINWRNSTNTGDLVLGVNGSGQLTFSGGFAAGDILFTNLVVSGTSLLEGAVTVSTLSTDGVVLTTSGVLSSAAHLPAAQFPALTGAITTSAGSLVTSIGAIDAYSLYGNYTGSSAAPVPVSIGATLSFNSTTLETLALTGDVTSSSNSFVTTIANNAVTYGQMQQTTAGSVLLGNPTGVAGNISEITLDPTLNFSGTTLVATTATTSQLGVVSPDGTTITISDGVISAVGGGGAVSSVSNSDSTLTISPTTGAVVASLNLANANTWTAQQTFSASEGIIVTGQTMSIGNSGANISVYIGNNFTGGSVGIGQLNGAQGGAGGTAFGHGALEANTGIYNTGVGLTSGASNGAGRNNTSVGFDSLVQQNGGSYNVAIGAEALEGNGNFSNNTAVGAQAGWQMITGSSDNTVLGYFAGYNVTTGTFNIIVGENGNISTGSNNILIGNSLSGTTATSDYQLDIGDVILGTGINNPSTSTITFPGNVTVTGTFTGGGSGAVSSVSNSDGTLTISPTTGSVVASLAALSSGDFLVGNGSNIATGVAMSGDATLANTGAITVGSIGGEAVSLAGAFTTSGAHTLTITTTGNTNVTLPTSGTLSTTTGTVTSVATNNGITGGTITTTGTIGLASIANNDILANISGSSAAPSANTLTAIIDSAIGSTQGNLLYRNGSIWTVLAPGTSGYVLQTGGASANPSWTAQTGAVTSVSGDGTIISNSSSTGAVTLTLETAHANYVLAGPTSGSAVSPTYRALVSADLPIATSSALGAVSPDGTIITVSSGAITVAKASASQFGVVEVDGTTITASSGVISAVAAPPAAKYIVQPYYVAYYGAL